MTIPTFIEKPEILVCNAILTNNRRVLEHLLAEVSQNEVDAALWDLANSKLLEAPVSGEHLLVKMSYTLPVYIQYLGQRAALLFPSLAQHLLRSSGLHHQMF